jgi:hypothetical protein
LVASSEVLEHVLPPKRKSNSLRQLISIEENPTDEDKQLPTLERQDTMKNLKAPDSHFFGIKSL